MGKTENEENGLMFPAALTSTKTDTEAFTKMIMKSFTLHSNGTQTIYKEREGEMASVNRKETGEEVHFFCFVFLHLGNYRWFQLGGT